MPPSIPVVQTPADISPSVTPKKNNLSRRRKTKRSKPRPVTPPKQEEDTTYRIEESSSPDVSTQYSSNANMMPYGMSPYGMSPYYGGMSPMMMGPLSNLNQYLFGIQNVVFSLTQAVQMLGMNQQALQHAFDSLTSMFENAVATFHELRALEAMKTETETEEQKNRRKRLKTIRWALLLGGSWLVHKIIRKITCRRRQIQYDGPSNGTSPLAGSYGPTAHGGYNYSPFSGPSMYGGGGHYGTSGGYF